MNNRILGVTVNALAEGLKFEKHYNLPGQEIINLLKVNPGDSWVARNWSDVSEWTADTALSVLLKELRAGFGEGLKHHISLPSNALTSIRLFDSMGKNKI